MQMRGLGHREGAGLCIFTQEMAFDAGMEATIGRGCLENQRVGEGGEYKETLF